MINTNLKNLILEIKSNVDKRISELIQNNEEKLTNAIKYSLLCNGKRLRPLLIIETARSLNCEYNENPDILTVACAIEMIHIFSLIHDDLPCMDNDNYRRGELTCHKKFNEYDALLAGDSLIALCFETIITKTKHLNFEEKCKIIEVISKAIGYQGMCLGQSLDIEFEKNKKSKSSDEAEKINILKTGFLFKACVEIGCILGKANKCQQEALINYSINFGKAFQLADDIKDNEINSSEIENVKGRILNLIKNCNDNLEKLNNNKGINNLKLLTNYCFIV